MKTIKTISVLAISSLLALGCAACGTENVAQPEAENKLLAASPAPTFTDPNTVISTYDNRDYNEYLLGDDAVIDNQWEGYGIGDPFIMRWDGAYYLYCSTLDTEIGVRGYKSVDLVNWTPVTGSGLRTGYVSEDNVTLAAYAPEVYYFNGTFYMYTSPAGAGHRVLTATSPEGPFVNQTENFGRNIDGSVFIDDDESMYFTYANTSGITIMKMTDMLTLDPSSSPVLNGTSIGGWTEGSYLMKRDGIYYLTYTGNNVTSDGYRIAYATADHLANDGTIDRNAFTRQQNNPLALEVGAELKGVGHSSSVMGPDLDSYYLAYHYLNSSGGPNRSLGIDRLTFNGTMMSTATVLEKSVKPALPSFYATGKDTAKFDEADGLVLSKEAAKANFSAEFNVKGAAAATFVVGYKDANNYADVTVDLSAKTVKLNNTVSGTTTTVATGTLVNEFSSEALHTVRVAARNGKVNVTFDNMTKISGASLEISAGKIGYKLASGAEIGYTAFSDVAMGMSDAREAKQATGFVGASQYLYDSTYTHSHSFSASSVVSVVDSNTDSRFEGWKSLTLGAEKDYASYLVYVGEAGRYGIELVYRAADGGKKIGIKIDGSEGGVVYRCTLPEIETDKGYVKAIVYEAQLTAGAHTVLLENVGSEVNFTAFRFVKTSAHTPQYEAALDNYAQKGADYKTIWKLKEGGHYAKAGTRQLVYFGDETIANFTLEVEVKLDGATGTGTAGIVFHADKYAASSSDSYRSIRGYYLALNNSTVTLERLNYADDSSAPKAYAKGGSEDTVRSDEFVKVKIEVRGNTITVYMATQTEEVYGEYTKLIEYTDDWSFSTGKLGLYTNGAAVIFKNLKVSA